MAIEERKAEESRKQRVYRTLRARIMSGAVAPGLAITINGVADDLGVSAMPVREALHRLVDLQDLVLPLGPRLLQLLEPLLESF